MIQVSPPVQLNSPSVVVPSFRGTLRIAGTQIPVRGALLELHLTTADEKATSSEPIPKEWLEVPLATALTDVEGAFAFTPDLSVLPPWAAPLLSCGDMLCLRLSIAGSKKRLIANPSPLAAKWKESMIFQLPYQEPERKKLNKLLKAATVADVSSIAGLAAYAGSIYTNHGLAPVEGAQAVAWLERAFIDPSGVLRKIAPLPDWNDLQQQGGIEAYRGKLGDAADRSDVVAALTVLQHKLKRLDGLAHMNNHVELKNANSTHIGDLIEAATVWFERPPLENFESPFPLGRPPLIGYRDYLVETWQKYIALRNKNPWGSSGNASPEQARSQLDHRFKQDFTTTNVTEGSANKFVIEIMLKILQAPKPPVDLGYGFEAATLPVQGTTSDRDYLNALIAASGVTAKEFNLRHRIDVKRPDTAQSSPVEENIATLQSFFRDSFQSDFDPSHANPNVYNAPIVQAMMSERAPFFLQYEEWLDANAHFFSENYVSLRRMLDSSKLRLSPEGLIGDEKKLWFEKTMAIMDEVDQAHRAFNQGQYQIAYGHYKKAWSSAFIQIQDSLVQSFDYQGILVERQRFKVSKKAELLNFELLMQQVKFRDRQVMWLVAFFGYAYYLWMGDTLLALGRLPQASRYYAVLSKFAIGAADFDNESGLFDGRNNGSLDIYQDGNLPYTFIKDEKVANLYYDPEKPDTVYSSPTVSRTEATYQFRPKAVSLLLHRLEVKMVALKLGEATLTWADTLFRCDDPSSTARARELYKSVLWIHGEDPNISPTWELSLQRPKLNIRRNPAVVSQTERAMLALYKLERGLNHYGYTDAYVPALRYRSLKESADRFAALAKAAQQDFISAMSLLENLTIEELKTSNLISKALKQQQIAAEQMKIATTNVAITQNQIKVVEREIAKRREDLDDKESLWNQLGDFLGGVAKTFEGLPFGSGKKIGSAFESEAGFSASSSTAFAGLGAGAGVMAGYAVFFYAGYTTMQSMEKTYNKLGDQIKDLENLALPAAKMANTVAESEQKISIINGAIVEADIQLGRQLLAYYDNKLLNADFWSAMATVLKRAMQRYLELGAWAGWLAERALSFEQSRNINIMRLDYYPRTLQGATGADLLQLDLAELEASHIAGTHAMVPFRHTFSLAVDFPLEFGQIKKHGRGKFMTDEYTLRAAYPGTFGHRINTVAVTLSGTLATKTLRGVLSNSGVSIASRDLKLTPGPMICAPHALPIGESGASTRLLDTALPAELLRPFEGSGTTSLWHIEFSDASTLPAINGLSDVLITVEGQALYADDALALVGPEVNVSRSIMLSGRLADTAGFANFSKTDVNQFRLAFDLPALIPARNGEARTIVNLGVVLLDRHDRTIKARLEWDGGNSVDFDIDGGYALSNGEPLRSSGSAVPDSPLNVVLGAALDRKLIFSFNRQENPEVDFTNLFDLALLLDYRVQN